jgi:hypothetical protein
MKKTVLIFFLLCAVVRAQLPEPGQAKGLFMGVGIGPRVPIGKFADVQNLGVGFEFTFSYTDNKVIPVFVYSSIGYEHYPGRQDFYKVSDYSSFSTNVVTMKLGARYYLPPLLNEGVLLLPIVEGGATFALYEKFHQFKLSAGRNNFTEDNLKAGFHAGVGVSMFILDAIISYNYLKDSEYISFDLRIRIPIFATL